MTDFDIDGRVYIVSGGGTGLGLGIARQLVRAGASVLITGRREEPLKQASKELGAACAYRAGDVTRDADAADMITAAVEGFGRLDGVVNNAGNHLKKPFEDTERDEFFSVLDVHLGGAFLLTREALPYLERSSDGIVLFISSMANFMGLEKVVAYTAAKSAVAGMTRQLAVELAPKGIRVNAIAPGWIGSPMLEEALSGDPARKQRILNRIAMHEFGAPEDIGNAAVYLASSAAKYISGVVLPVDGGATASL